MTTETRTGQDKGAQDTVADANSVETAAAVVVENAAQDAPAAPVKQDAAAEAEEAHAASAADSIEGVEETAAELGDEVPDELAAEVTAPAAEDNAEESTDDAAAEAAAPATADQTAMLVRVLATMLHLDENVVKAADWDEPKLSQAFNTGALNYGLANICDIATKTGQITALAAAVTGLFVTGFVPLALGAAAVGYVAHNLRSGRLQQIDNIRMAVLDDVAHNTVIVPQAAAPAP